MHLAKRATGIACFIFAGALIGNALQWLLPAHHVADAEATIGMVQGLVRAAARAGGIAPRLRRRPGTGRA